MGVRHVVVLGLRSDVSDEARQAVLEGLARLPSLIAEIRNYSFGGDAGLTEGNGDLAIVADFDDVDGYRTYAAHPDHQRFITEVLRPVVESRTAVQFETR